MLSPNKHKTVFALNLETNRRLEMSVCLFAPQALHCSQGVRRTPECWTEDGGLSDPVPLWASAAVCEGHCVRQPRDQERAQLCSHTAWTWVLGLVLLVDLQSILQSLCTSVFHLQNGNKNSICLVEVVKEGFSIEEHVVRNLSGPAGSSLWQSNSLD